MKLTSSAVGLCGPADHRTSARRLAPPRLGPQLMRGRYTAREDPLRAAIFSTYLLLAPVLTLAQEPQGQFGAYHWTNSRLRFPDGDSLTVYRVKFWQFDDGSPPALQLEYEPPVSVADIPAIRRNLDRIWPFFQPYVEARHLSGAIVTATNLVRHGTPPLPWTATFKSYGF